MARLSRSAGSAVFGSVWMSEASAAQACSVVSRPRSHQARSCVPCRVMVRPACLTQLSTTSAPSLAYFLTLTIWLQVYWSTQSRVPGRLTASGVPPGPAVGCVRVMAGMHGRMPRARGDVFGPGTERAAPRGRAQRSAAGAAGGFGQAAHEGAGAGFVGVDVFGAAAGV